MTNDFNVSTQFRTNDLNVVYITYNNTVSTGIKLQ